VGFLRARSAPTLPAWNYGRISCRLGGQPIQSAANEAGCDHGLVGRAGNLFLLGCGIRRPRTAVELAARRPGLNLRGVEEVEVAGNCSADCLSVSAPSCQGRQRWNFGDLIVV
jgi:hypothetical protein